MGMKYTCYDDITRVESAWVRLATVAINGSGGVVVVILITAYVAAEAVVAVVAVLLLLRMPDCVYVCLRVYGSEQRRWLTSC